MPNSNPETLSKRMLDKNPKDAKQNDFISFGGPRHAALLGIRPVVKDETPPPIVTMKSKSGQLYTFVDATQYLQINALGTPLFSERVLLEILGSKIRELDNPPTVPKDAPRMFVPDMGVDGVAIVNKPTRIRIHDDGTVEELP